MSTAIIKTATGFEYYRVAPRRQPVPAVRPNYVARRVGAAAAAVVAVITMFTLFNGVLASFSGQPAEAAGAQPAELSISSAESAASTHVARSGDSLWSIADQHRGAVDRDRYLDALIRLNGDTSIEIGQAVVLP